jgi:hypothetical protein
MFGMENEGKKEKGKQGSDMVFDLEKEISAGAENYKKLKAKIQTRVGALKEMLRSGSDKDDFDKYGMLLHGYVSLKKVMERVRKKHS